MAHLGCDEEELLVAADALVDDGKALDVGGGGAGRYAHVRERLVAEVDALKRLLHGQDAVILKSAPHLHRPGRQRQRGRAEVRETATATAAARARTSTQARPNRPRRQERHEHEQ